MSFIGAKPSQTLATPTSQYFNGTGSQTVFTLNRAVNVAEDLEVFVNNIQQEPGVGKSYTAVGTTLTFDAAPSSGTANVYVVYRGLAEVTTRLEHDPNAALTATTGTFSGAFTSPGIDDNATSTAMTLDGSGNVGIGGQTTVYKLAVEDGTGATRVNVRNTANAAPGSGIFFEVLNGASVVGNGTIATQSNGDMAFFTGTSSGAERMRLLAGGGLTFNGETAAAHALDDYEEGLYTASITTTSGSITLGYNQLKFTKIGRLVTVMGLLYVSSVSSPSGYATLNLPFTVSSGDNYSNRSAGVPYGTKWVSLNANQATIVATESDTKAYFIDISGSLTSGINFAQQFQAATEFFVTFSYHTD